MSLATKYRPTTFAEVVGQESVKTILQNQIKAGDVKNGYLFEGGAGTGKTTTARLFAKAIDAEVIEIDGASNNGVDNVRELSEAAKYRPMRNKYKVFIIDEVHMLSTGAFNALLKTLEEPPSYVVFILATTDPQKIPATVLSRVQRFRFSRLAMHEVYQRLNEIAAAEGLQVDKGATEYIAKLADGGMRDAITILDKCLGFVDASARPLTFADVIDAMGVTPYEWYFELIRAKLRGDDEKVLLVTESWHESGKDLKHFIKGLIEFIVDVEKYRVLGNLAFTSIPAVYEEEVTSFAFDANLMSWFKPLNELLNSVKYDQRPKTVIQGALLLL